MATVRPFAALRPPATYAEQVSSLPYDVMNHREAKEMASGHPTSFLHICRSDIDLQDESMIHEPEAYAKARENLMKFEKAGILVRDTKPCFYIYRQMMWGRVQTGIVACASVDEYLNGTVKRHELTRREKELDRICHFDACSAQTEPVFLAYRKDEGISHEINEWIKFHQPTYEFKTDDGVTHILWPVDDDNVIARIHTGFERVDALYIADGHHRTASSAAVSKMRREAHPDFTGGEEFNYLMAVIFCDEDLFIMDYNRVVRDLNGMSSASFLEKLDEHFDVKLVKAGGGYSPRSKHEFGMFLDDHWYSLTVKAGSYDESDAIESLDCAILQSLVLQPLLGIDDPRTSTRIDFVGGIRGLGELERRCKDEMKLAFSLYPVTMADLFRVADAGQIMPPKSTWFEPKLRSGLFVHTIEQ
ncbi:MAG: DUF1015 family protein [Akkermansia sp.]